MAAADRSSGRSPVPRKVPGPLASPTTDATVRSDLATLAGRPHSFLPHQDSREGQRRYLIQIPYSPAADIHGCLL